MSISDAAMSFRQQPTERRSYGIRRDINDLVRDESGKISGSKLGTYAGQIISGHLLLMHSADIIPRWDSMTVLFLVLIAPEAYKRLLALKWGGGGPGYTERTEKTTTVATASKTIDHPPKKEPQ